MSLVICTNQCEPDVNFALAQADSWGANHTILPSPEQARQVSGLLAAEVRRLQGSSPASGAIALDATILSGLSYAQLEFMRTVAHSRAEVADYLRRGIDVVVVPNNEVSEAPPFALDVVENPSFWIGCFDTPEQAREVAEKIGLRFCA